MSKNIFSYLKVIIMFSLLLFIFQLRTIKAESLNECIKNAVEKKIKLNRILSLCRDNISSIDIYSNDYLKSDDKVESNYISTNKMDKVINELIEKGDLSRASRLVERQEIEKTKRIKAKAEAEALRAPQIISTSNNSVNSNKDSNVRSTLVLSTNPIASISAGSKILEITTPAAHGALPGQYVEISNVDASIDGIAASEINKFHVISSVPSVTKFRISVLSSASSGSVSGGGSDIIAKFQK